MLEPIDHVQPPAFDPHVEACALRLAIATGRSLADARQAIEALIVAERAYAASVAAQLLADADRRPAAQAAAPNRHARRRTAALARRGC